MSEVPVLVVMPLYNAKPYVRQAIESILCQTYSSFKFLIINDGSTDGSEQIARSFRDPRIEVYDQPNSGPGAAMNRAIAYALELGIPYIARMDSDDISCSERLNNQLILMQRNTKAAACSANCYYIDPETSETIGTSTVSRQPWLIRWEIFHGLRGLIQGTCMFRTYALSEIGGYRTIYKKAEETDVFLRLAEHFEMVNCVDFLYKIRLRTDSISLSDVHENVMYHYYALDCSLRRRSGQSEKSFEALQLSHSIWKYFWIWREENVIKLWRKNMAKQGLGLLLAAALIDPRRAVIRTIRKLSIIQ